MLGVVVLHYNNMSIGGGFAFVQKGSLNEIMMYFLESFSIGAVNVFVLITGYFMVNTRKSGLFKPLCLLAQVMFVRILFYVIDLLTGYQTFSVKMMIYSLLPRYWFFSIYVALLLICPLLNVVINNLDGKGHRVLLVLPFILFSVQPMIIDVINEIFGPICDEMSFYSGTGQNSGYNIVQFVLMYIAGALIRKHEADLGKFSFAPCFLVYILCSVVNTVLNLFFDSVLRYSNPIVVVGSIAVFMAFLKLKLKPNQVINTLAKSAFTVYLTNPLSVQILWNS